MDTRQMKQLFALVDGLAATQRRELVRRLQTASQPEQVLEMVESHLDGPARCPHCQCGKLVRNGHADGLQRYKCRGCSRTFNALSTIASIAGGMAGFLSRADEMSSPVRRRSRSLGAGSSYGRTPVNI